MSTKKITPNTTSQTSGGKFQTFKDLKNINAINDKYAVTELVHGKTKPLNRPSTVTVSNFKAGLPTGSLITRIQVKYKHEKVAYNNKVCNIPTPTISLMNGKKVMKYSNGKLMSKKGEAPVLNNNKNKITENTVTFNSNWEYNEINNKDFSVRIDYPTNTNDDEGYLRIHYVYIIITYKTPAYSLSINKVDGGVNGKEYTLTVWCSNKNGVTYSPPIVITTPPGFTLKKHTEAGKLVANGARTFTWTPKFKNKISSDVVILIFDTNVTFPSGSDSYSGTFEAQETLTGEYKSHTAVIHYESQVSQTSETGESGNTANTGSPSAPEVLDTVYAVQGELSPPCYIELTDEDMTHNKIHFLIKTENMSDRFSLNYNPHPNNPHYLGNTTTASYAHTMEISSSEFEDRLLEYKVRFNTMGHYKMSVSYSYTGASGSWTLIKSFYLSIIPSTLTLPYFKMLSLTNEELLRLGDGIPYIAQTYMKLISNESYVRDWIKNFRIGIFNNRLQDHSRLIQVIDSSQVSQSTATFNISNNILNELDGFDSFNVKSEIGLDTSINGRQITVQPQYEVGSFNMAVELLNQNNEVLTSCDAFVDFTNQMIKLFEDNYYDGHIDYYGLDSKDIFINAEYWSPCLKNVNEFENLECNFTYNKSYPLHILLTGDYIEGTPNNNNICFSEPCIVENDHHYEGWEPNGTFPISIDNLVKKDNSSEVTLPALGTINRVILYDLPLEKDYGTNTDIAIRGIELRGNIEKSDDDIILRVKLINSMNESRERSIVLNEHDTNLDSDSSFSVGGMGDLWGFSTLEIVNLEDWKVEIQPDNTLNNSESYLNIGNLELIIYVQNVEHQQYKCRIEGEDLSYYGVFVTKVDIPEGLETDTRYIKVDGTDTNYPYSQNINPKTITVEFDIGDACDLEGNTLSLRELTRLLVTKRDEYHRPIPKRIEFDHYPNVYWEYVLEKTLDNDLEINTYDAKLQLTIPEGTAFAKNRTVTNNIGYVSGIVNIHPIIIFKPIAGAETIQINEELSQQSFNMGYSGWEDKYVEIDCENQKATLLENDDDETGKDISGFVDWTSDWFYLIEEYFFTCVNCKIHSISYRERW